MKSKTLYFAGLFLVSVLIGLEVPAVSQAAIAGDVKWSVATGASVTSSPAIGSDGTIYVGSEDGKLYAINPAPDIPEAERQLWAYDTADVISSSPAIGSDGTIYVGLLNGKLYAINPAPDTPEAERQLWAYDTGTVASVFSPAIGADGTIYVGSENGYLYAINPVNGDQLWVYDTADVISSSPAIGSDGTIYVGSLSGKLYAINPAPDTPEAERQLWAYDTGTVASVSSPAIGADGTIYVGSGNGYLHAINPAPDIPEAERQLWVYDTGTVVNVSSPAIGSDGTIYVGSLSGYLYAINTAPDIPEAERQLWVYQTGASVSSSPAIGSDGTIYVGSNDFKLHAVNPNGGTQLWACQTEGSVSSSPAIGPDGTIYVGSGDKNLYAIQSDSAGLAVTPWPKFRHDNMNTGFAEIFTLTVSSTTGGSVTVPGEGIYDYSSGAAVDLVATPDSGYHFVNWSGDVADVNSVTTTITMNANRIVTANFDSDPAPSVVMFTLTVSSTAGGSVTVPGEGIYDYSSGAAVDLVATPDSGYHFVNWSGDVADVNSATTTVTMSANRIVTANFDSDPDPAVTDSFIEELINQLENDQITGISDLESLDAAMAPIIEHFDSFLDQVADLASDDPVRGNALNSVVENAERLFEQQLEVMQPLMNTDVSAEEITDLLGSTGEIAQALIATELPLTQTMFESNVAISELAFQTVLDDVLISGGIDAQEIQTMIDNPESAREFLSESSNLNFLDELVSLSGIAIDSVNEVEREAVSQLLQDTGFSDALTDRVMAALPEVMNVALGLLEVEGEEPETVLSLLDEQLTSTSTADALSSFITTTFTNNDVAAHTVTGISIVPDYMPQGSRFLPDGTVISIQDNIAVRLAPAPANPVAVAAELADSGLTPECKSDGRLILSNSDGDSEQYVMNFGWLLEGNNSFSSGAVSFSVTGTDPASEAYAFLVTYEDGSSQNAVPMIMAKDSLLEILETLLSGRYSLNLQTGVLNLTDAGIGRYKADWAFESLTTMDLAAIQDAGGLVIGDEAFEVGDYNADGVIDLWYYSSEPMGRQILYGLCDQ